MKKMLNVLLWFWQLPQHIIALIVILLYRAKATEQQVTPQKLYLVKSKVLSGGSFGNYVILEESYMKSSRLFNVTLKHEYGHSIQSLYFGPLYLLIIGIPSLINNLRARYDKRVYDTYYSRYPEKWADRLGGVTR